MTELPTREDYFQIGAQEVLRRGEARSPNQRITREVIFAEGTDTNLLLAATSAMADEATRHLALRMAALFLDSAEDEDLDRLVADRYSPEIVRKQPSQALVTLTFTRAIPPSSGALVSVPTGTKIRTATGVEFETTTPVVFPLNGTGPYSAEAKARLAGPTGNVAAGTITQFSAAPLDAAIQVTNSAIAAGGALLESDDSLRERARGYFRNARRGTLGAIETGALSVLGVTSATAFESVDANGNPSGFVSVYIADANGQANELLARRVRDALLEYRAGGVVVTVLTSVPLLLGIAYVIGFVAGTDTLAAAQQLRELTVATVNGLAPGEVLPLSLLQSIARSVPGAIVLQGSVTLPVGDLTPGASEVIKTALTRVTVNGV
jgi:uncharacterized phage protein gp47/JayE